MYFLVPEKRKIGVLTSGGDCAGLNAAIRAITFRVIKGYGWRVFGIRQSTHGLMRRPVDAEELTRDLFTGHVLRMAGTMLGTVNRGDPFAVPMANGTLADRSQEIIDGYHELGLDALICIGDDGSLAILLPEIEWDAEVLARKIDDVRNSGRNFGLMLVAEAARLPNGEIVRRAGDDGGIRLGGIGHVVGELIEERTGTETRVTVLGHVMRGGLPSARDRLFASAFGVAAVDLFARNKFDRLVVSSSRNSVDVPLEDGIAHHQSVDPDGPLLHTARGLGIYLGGKTAP